MLAWFPVAVAQEVYKADNTSALQLGASWVGGNAPTASDIAVWDSTVTGANNTLLNGTLDVLGIRIDNPGGTVSITQNASTNLTLGSGGITVIGADFAFSGNGATPPPFALSAAQTWSIASGRTLTLGSSWRTITGAYNLAITGPGSLLLADGDNNDRSYQFGTGALTLGGGVRIINGANDQWTRTRTITNATTLNGNITLQTNGTGGGGTSAFLFSGGLDIGSANRTVTLAMPNSVAAAGSVRTGVLSITSANGITGTGKITFLNESTDPAKSAGVMIGAGGSLGVAHVEVGNNVTLGFSVGAGADIGAGTAITLQAGGTLALVAGNLNQAGNRTIKSLAGAGTVTNLAGNAGTSILTIDGGTNTGTTTFTGIIEDRVNNATTLVGITKTGTTTQIFSGANTYIGGTTINGGTLLINGSHVQNLSTNANGYLVNAGGTLGGTGLIARFTTQAGAQSIVNVASGGTLAPGGVGALGSLKLDGQYMSGAGAYQHLNMQAGAEFAFNLAGNGSGADTLDFWNYVLGDLALNNNAVDLSLLGPQVSGTYTVDLFRFYSNDGVTLTASGITSGLTMGDLGAGIVSANFIYENEIGGASGLIKLQYTVVAIPEPSSAFLAAAGLIGLLLHRRSRSAHRH